ncbi:HAD family phosphatase [Streptomyces sp. NPDC005322]|uniref:HAD family hydrolase n=1 Tax=unclassified Streptomyces TaxID=2593676 RepID=UPI0033A2BD6B
MTSLPGVDTGALRALLCDADNVLFPSEEPAWVASTGTTNAFLAEMGVDRQYTPDELRAVGTGKNFRSSALTLAAEHGVPAERIDPVLERWVQREKEEVTAYLRKVLHPDPDVLEPLTELSRDHVLAVVSSSALSRLDACLEVTGLAPLFPPERRFSAEDSLPVPTSKPDPAVYTFACRTLEIASATGLAVEDSVPGALSAVGAGCPTVGDVMFVPLDERAERTRQLREAGAVTVVSGWRELAPMLSR